MLNKPTSYRDLSEELTVAWNSCENQEVFTEELKSSIKHLLSLLDRYGIAHEEINIEVRYRKTYDCSTYDAEEAWYYYFYLERRNRKLEKILNRLNDLLSDYGMEHPEIMNDPGII